MSFGVSSILLCIVIHEYVCILTNFVIYKAMETDGTSGRFCAPCPVGVVVVAGIIRTTTTPTLLISFYLLL